LWAPRIGRLSTRTRNLPTDPLRPESIKLLLESLDRLLFRSRTLDLRDRCVLDVTKNLPLLVDVLAPKVPHHAQVVHARALSGLPI